MGILRRATRNISRRKTRALLVIVALSFALAMLISIPPSINASQITTQKTIDNLTVNAKVVNSTVNLVATEIDCHLPVISVPDTGPYHNQTTLEQPLMNLTDYSNLTSIPDVTNVVPILNQAENNSNFTYSVYGVPLDNASLLRSYPIVLPSNITAGRNLQTGDSDVVVLQERVANYLNAGVGKTVNILGQSFTVVGIEGYDPLNETAVYMNLTEAQVITNNVGNVTSFMIFVDNVNNVEGAANKISIMYPKLSVSIASSLIDSVIQMQTQTNEELQMAQASMSQIQSTGTMEIAIVTVVVAAIVLFIMLYTVRERTREIGTLKALGASNAAILGQFMLEGELLSFIAGVVGVVIGIFGASFIANLLLPHPTLSGAAAISSTSVNLGNSTSAPIIVAITPNLILASLGVALLLGAVGSVYPALKAARTRPAEAMRYE